MSPKSKKAYDRALKQKLLKERLNQAKQKANVQLVVTSKVDERVPALKLIKPMPASQITQVMQLQLDHSLSKQEEPSHEPAVKFAPKLIEWQTELDTASASVIASGPLE